MIDKICAEHTDLTSEDVRKIQEVAETIHLVADLMGVDVFIDCPTRDPDVAVVVAQAQPSNGKTLYQGSVVGEFAIRTNEPAALRTLDIGMPTIDLMAMTQEHRNVRQNVSAIKNSHGKIIGCLIAETDITDDLKAKRSLTLLSKTTEQLTEALVHTSQSEQGIPYHVTDGIIIFDQEGIATFANPVARKIFQKLGYMNNLEGLHFSNVTLERTDFADILANNQVNSSEVKLAGLVLNVKFLVAKRGLDNQANVVMLIRDDTDVKAKEKELILKSVAIKEIHHRVKNNLQTIASLLRLQSRRIDNDSAQKAFSESINRVLSIAATHEILAEKGIDDVDLSMMLRRIIRNVAMNGGEANTNIRVDIQGDSIRTNSDIASTIALVVNELIQNCYNHAFVGRDEGNIRVEIRRGNRYSNISIVDDGVGFDTNTEPARTSLGNKIVQQLVSDKLGGHLTVESGEKGTNVFFDFFCESNFTD